MTDPKWASRFVELRDASPEARRAALGWVELRLDDEPDLQRRALELLGYWGELRYQRVPMRVAERVRSLVTADEPEVRREACATLALLRPEERWDPSASLIDALSDPAPTVRQEAAAALGDLRASSARSALTRGLEDPHPAVRFECAFALSAFRDDVAREELESALSSPAFRAYAIEGLRRLADPESTGPLRKLARGFFTPWPERLAASAALASLGDEVSARELARRARRGRFEVRSYAVYLIGHAKLVSLKPLVDEIADDGRSRLRPTAVQAVAKFGDPGDDARLDAWLLTSDLDEAVRLEALDALADRDRRDDLRAWLEAGRLSGSTALTERARERLGD